MELLTTGQIAKLLGIDRDRVSYIVRKADVKPLGRAGAVRLFPESAITVIEQKLKTRQRPGGEGRKDNGATEGGLGHEDS